MVPNGWKKTHLKCVISGTIKNGYSPLPASTTTGYWVLSLGALTDHGINPLEIKPVVVDEKVKQALLSDGDFLISRSNTPDKVGRSIRFKNEVQNCSYPDLMMRFCVDTKKADPNFIEIKLKSTEVRQYYKSCAAGSSSSMVKINKAVVENTPLLLPSFPEQKKIAKILSTWDKAITTTEQLLANSQQQKKALMQQLLTGQKRLLDIKTGVIFDRDFKTLSLRDVCSMQAGKFINASDILNGHQDGTYPCFGGNGLRGYTKTFTHDGEFSLIGRQGALCGNITFATGCFHATEHAVVVTPRSNINTKWLYYALVDLNLNQYATGVAQPGLSVKNIEQVSIKVPESINEQQKIAAVLSAADQEITTLKQKLDVLKQEKKALMQQLLTGKRRVKVEEAA
ncbi:MULTISPECIES: restriction endonuclease subunit S [Aeromonas]|uniref:restriction endonuclease subunit S n=1 Tax=Aeromonas TaxID=642 RepID=UPI0009B81F01|nr:MULTISPECIES: restriction endonuclease subunit S [Aeromonas]QWZ64371.1 restriction endonuclease subunit S [Aeromonas sp. FDAARGOS 1417]